MIQCSNLKPISHVAMVRRIRLTTRSILFGFFLKVLHKVAIGEWIPLLWLLLAQVSSRSEHRDQYCCWSRESRSHPSPTPIHSLFTKVMLFIGQVCLFHRYRMYQYHYHVDRHMVRYSCNPLADWALPLPEWSASGIRDLKITIHSASGLKFISTKTVR
jgi:hypothetical protein